MATYTPNLNLGKPEATDAFSGFRQLFNDNMDILDNGGGGGSGGHTIVNENGTDMPAEGKLQFTGNVSVTDDSGNGKTVVDILGGGGNVYGAFIDTNRIITSGTYSVNFSYTATEDCFVYAVVPFNGNTGGQLQIDGETINGWWNGSGGTISESFVVPVKKGQTITATATNSSASNYIVYGLTQGTNGIFTPIIYSDTERVVGVWRDNKPLYQRTWDLGSDVLINSNTWTNTSITVADVNFEKIVGSQGVNSGGTNFGFIGANRDQTYVQILQTRNSAISIRYLTLLYTKTTDVAGSGNWNTDGVPTVHYSTSEQVIGTWIDGKPIYQKSVEIGTVNGGSGKNVAHGISDFKRLVGHECTGYNTADSAWCILSKVDNDASSQREFKVNATYVTIGNSANSQTFTDVVATIRYTKTTD